MAAAKLRDNCIILSDVACLSQTGIPVVVSNGPTLYPHRGIHLTIFSIGRGVGLGDFPQTPIPKLPTAVSIRLGNARARHTLSNLYASALGPSRIWFERK